MARYACARAWAAQDADQALQPAVLAPSIHSAAPSADQAVQPAALRDAEEEAKAAARRAEHEAEVVRHEHFRREVWLIATDCD